MVLNMIKYDGHNWRKNDVGYYIRTVQKNNIITKIFLHRYIWEKNNGPILSGNIVHHINGNIIDNRLVNLKNMTSGEHTRIHKKNITLSKQHKLKISKSVSKAMKGVKKSESHKRSLSKAIKLWHKNRLM